MVWNPEANEVFLQALDADSPEKRVAFLDQRCAGNPELLKQVQSLLDADQRAGNLLETSPYVPDLDSGCSPGAAIGPYKLLQKLGQGGFGVVFMAEQQQPVRRKVALKVIKPGMDTQQVVARFEAERQALALMDHPNIARVFDAGATPSGRPYFVMELVNGLPITDYCDRSQLNPRKRLELFIDVCKAVQHAHQKGIIHRDIKPSNVLITLHDGAPVVKVIDFGIAKATGQQLTEHTLFTQFGQIIGTPLYMSPEQMDMSHLDIDTRSDIYSLGVLLYELLTGTTPFAKDRLRRAAYDEIRRIICEEEPPKPSTRVNSGVTLANVAAQRNTDPKKLRDQFRGDVDWIVMKALEKDRTRRYETANSLLRDIQRYLNDEPVEACPPSPFYRFGKFARRNRRVLVTTVSGLLIAAVATVSFAIYYAYAANRLAKALADADHLTASLALDRGQSLCEQGDTGPGLLWMARSLSFAMKAHDSTLERAIRINLAAWWNQIHPLRGCLRHPDRVNAMTFSPDGSRIATSCADGKARLWDAATGEPIGLPLSPSDQQTIAAIAFRPDGTELVTGGAAGTASRWDAKSGAPIEPSFAHGAPIDKILWAYRGKGCVIAGGRSVSVWDSETGICSTRLDHDASVTTVALSADGETVFTGTETGFAALWNVSSGTQLGTPLLHLVAVRAAAFQTSGDLVATGDEIGHLRLWNTKTATFVCDAPRHNAAVTALEFSRNGRQLLSAGLDWKVRIADVDETSAKEKLALPHLAPVESASFSPDERFILSGSRDGRGRIWNAASGDLVGSPLLHQAEVYLGAFNPDGTSVALAGNSDTVRLWGIVAPDVTFKSVEYPEYIYTAAFSPDGSLLATAGEGDDLCPIRLWDVSSGQERKVLAGHERTVRTLAFSSDSKRLVSGGGDGTARIWDLETGNEKSRTEEMPGWVSAVAFSPDGQLLLTGSRDGSVRLWNLGSGGRQVPELSRVEFPSHGGAVFSAAFSPDGKRWMTGSADMTAHLGATSSGQLLCAPLRHQGQVWSVTFSPVGGFALTGSDDRMVRVWDGTTGQAVDRPLVDSFMTRFAKSSPDGQFIFKGGLNTGSRLWDRASRKPLGPPIPHQGPVYAAVIPKDGRHIVLAGEELRAWSVPVILEPMPGHPDRLTLECRLMTGMELGADDGLRVLDSEAWHLYRGQLAGLQAPVSH